MTPADQMLRAVLRRGTVVTVACSLAQSLIRSGVPFRR